MRQVGDAFIELQFCFLWNHAIGVLNVVVGVGRLAGEHGCFVFAVQKRIAQLYGAGHRV